MSITSGDFFNVYFFQPNQTTKKSVGQLPKKFKLSDLKTLFEKLFPSPPYGQLENYRVTIKGFDLNVQIEAEFNKNKHLIQPGSMLYPIQRMVGGSEVDITTLKEIIRLELSKELEKLPKSKTPCSIDGGDELCLTMCCYKYCPDCFILGFQSSKYQLKCPKCSKILNYDQFFKSQEFIQTLECLEQLNTFQKCIDYQVCKCGSPMVNETMYAQQQCIQCKRRFCFFCNNDWEGGMKNEKYSCRKDCTYETMLLQDSVKLKYNPQIDVPNKRICPKCYRDGGYGNCCKYNKCPNCEHWFCFICLKSQVECEKTSTFSTKCTETVKQGYEIFPRLLKS